MVVWMVLPTPGRPVAAYARVARDGTAGLRAELRPGGLPGADERQDGVGPTGSRNGRSRNRRGDPRDVGRSGRPRGPDPRSHEPIAFVDLRPPAEFGRGRLPHARSIPLGEPRRRYAEIPRVELAEELVVLDNESVRLVLVTDPTGRSGSGRCCSSAAT